LEVERLIKVPAGGLGHLVIVQDHLEGEDLDQELDHPAMDWELYQQDRDLVLVVDHQIMDRDLVLDHPKVELYLEMNHQAKILEL